MSEKVKAYGAMDIWDVLGEITADELPEADLVVRRRLAAGADAFQLHLVRGLKYDPKSNRLELTVEDYT